MRVCCRVRPQNAKELAMTSARRCVSISDDTIEVKTGDGPPQKFAYDHVFGEEASQQTVFESVALPVVQDLMDGYNATIFAYGQTSSGKTYTMEGASIDDPELRGIIPRTATEIFNNVMAADENLEFIVKVSYIEIYMERIRDLLDPYKSKVNLQVREDAQRGIFVEGMTETCVTSDEELLATMREGASNRAVAATGMNEGSSRSHSVFIVTLFQRHLENGATKAGKLYLVDLAGSEMVRKTGASGKQLEEAKTINKSLSALGMVINALTDSNVSHVPYRDSKLTRVLQESLGGNSRTALIINVSPSSYNTPETISTLRFGTRAKSIKNKAVVNEQRSVEEYKILLANAEKLIAKQQTYIISLEARLSGAPGGPLVRPDADDVSSTTAGAQATVTASASSSSDSVKADDVHVDVAVDDSGATSRAARVLEELQERVNQLEEELAEEKMESTRRGEEIRLLTAKLDEHIKALETSHVLNEELRKVKDLQEKSMEEKIRQREAALSELRADHDRLSFEHKELRIHAETLQHEFSALMQEMPANGAASPTGALGKLAAAAAASANEAEEEKTDATGGTSGGETTETTAGTPSSPQSQTAGDDAAPAESPSGSSAQLRARCAALEAELKEYEAEYRQLQQAAEREKTRLSEDVERKAGQIRDLEQQLERLAIANGASADNAGGDGGSDGSSASTASPATASASNHPSGMSARERQHMRSIQQKLEQLVAVHRQLLRKYASLELELMESKKKLALRDERIKQVEANNRIMAGNMRAQAEKHVEELTRLRDQIADFRGAQRSHFEAQLSSQNTSGLGSSGFDPTSSVIKTLRAGSFYNDGVIRPIRGGGKRKTMVSGPGGTQGPAFTGLMPSGTGPSADSTAAAPSLGFLNRLFGKTT